MDHLPPRPTDRHRLIAALAAVVALAAALGAVAPSPAAPIPGYRLDAEWPAGVHGLPAPNNIAIGADGRIWLLDGPAQAVVALLPDGTVAERRVVPEDTLDLAVGPTGELYLGRWTGRPRAGQAMHNVSRVEADGVQAWTRKCECSTGSGIAATQGRVWLTDPAAKALRWLGTGDGRVTGEITAGPAMAGFPADVDASPDGTLFATDLVGGAVYAWPAPYLPGDYASWTMLESSGPFRIGAGTQPDGAVLVAVLFSDGLIRVHRPDGTLVARFVAEGEPLDLAVGQGGRIYVLDEVSRAVRVYVPGPPPTATPLPTDPPVVPASCQLVGTRVVERERVDRCDTVGVTLTLRADCPPDALAGADVLLILDRSLSMIAEGKMDAAKSAAKRFLAGLDLRYHRAALVTFSTDATVDQALTADRAAIEGAVDMLVPHGSGTDIQASIHTAMRHFQATGRPNALPVIVLLTDGRPNLPVVPEADTAALAAAERARARRAYVVTIGLGRFIDSLLLEAIASQREDFYYAPSVVDLDRIYQSILRVVESIGLTDVVVEDRPRPGVFAYEPGSSQPPALVVNDALQWTRPVLPRDGLTLTYRAAALQPGRFGLGAAFARYTDADGTERTFAFPEPDVEVVGVGPGGTGTPDPAAPTPRPTLPAAPDPVTCPDRSAWRVGLAVFPDSAGYGGQACPGCNGVFDGADRWDRGYGDVPPVVLIQAADGRVLWREDMAARPDGPARAVATLCEPPPYRVSLAQIPMGYASCPNSPSVRTLTARDFNYVRWSSARFALWSGCGLPTQAPVPEPTLPACP